MSSRHGLRAGLTRMFPDHRTPMAVAYRREHRAIIESLGITDPLLVREASRVAFLTVRAREAGRQWAELVEKRRTGRGKRPSLAAVERARKAAALDDLTATQGLDRLRALVGEKPTLSPRELLDRANAAIAEDLARDE